MDLLNEMPQFVIMKVTDISCISGVKMKCVIKNDSIEIYILVQFFIHVIVVVFYHSDGTSLSLPSFGVCSDMP